MKKKIIILLSVLIVIAAGVYFYFRSGEKKQEITIVTGKAQYGYIAKTVTAMGTIQPVDTVSIGAQVSGVVKKVYADFNSVVKQGQLLAKVDPSIITAQTEQSKANLANAKSNLDYQQSNYNRQLQLFNLGAISKADYQLALNQYNSAKSSVANTAAQLRLAEKNLSYTNIYSPINGVVLNRNVSEGQTIASSFNAPTLFVIAKDLTRMQVRAAVDEADIGAVKAGQNVTFTVDAFPDDIFEGIVLDVLLHASVSANVVTYATLINVDNKAMKLKPGMTANINIYIEEDSNALLIPARSLTFKPDSSLLKGYYIKKAEKNLTGAAKTTQEKQIHQKDTTKKSNTADAAVRKSYVWIRSGDTIVERRIMTGLNDDAYVRVIKGITPGEEVITNIVKATDKNAAAVTQKSPFMPQMQRRPSTNTRTQ